VLGQSALVSLELCQRLVNPFLLCSDLLAKPPTLRAKCNGFLVEAIQLSVWTARVSYGFARSTVQLLVPQGSEPFLDGLFVHAVESNRWIFSDLLAIVILHL